MNEYFAVMNELEQPEEVLERLYGVTPENEVVTLNNKNYTYSPIPIDEFSLDSVTVYTLEEI